MQAVGIFHCTFLGLTLSSYFFFPEQYIFFLKCFLKLWNHVVNSIKSSLTEAEQLEYEISSSIFVLLSPFSRNRYKIFQTLEALLSRLSLYVCIFFLDVFCLFVWDFHLKVVLQNLTLQKNRYTFLSQVHAYSRYFIPFHPSRTGYFFKVYLLKMITLSFVWLCNPSFSSLYILQEQSVKFTLNFSSLNPVLG